MSLHFFLVCSIILCYISVPCAYSAMRDARVAEHLIQRTSTMEHINELLGRVYNSIHLIELSDILDILIVTFVVYKVMEIIRKTHSSRLAKGIFVLVVTMLLAELLKLTMIRFFIREAFQLGLIAVVILFQPELRRILERLGSGKITGLFSSTGASAISTDNTITQTVLAYDAMSSSKTGALVVFERDTNLSEHMNTGTILDADITNELLRNIFFEPAPLHDGAVIIRDGRIAAAGCMLPLSNNNNLSHDLGMRHRAAIGISEHSDAVVAVVSEETGAISVAINGMMKRHLDLTTFEAILRSELLQNEETVQKPADKLATLLSNLKRKNHEDESN